MVREMAIVSKNESIVRVLHVDGETEKLGRVRGYWEAIPGWSWSGLGGTKYIPADAVGKEQKRFDEMAIGSGQD